MTLIEIQTIRRPRTCQVEGCGCPGTQWRVTQRAGPGAEVREWSRGWVCDAHADYSAFGLWMVTEGVFRAPRRANRFTEPTRYG